jgi:hypothetical protein
LHSISIIVLWVCIFRDVIELIVVIWYRLEVYDLCLAIIYLILVISDFEVNISYAIFIYKLYSTLRSSMISLLKRCSDHKKKELMLYLNKLMTTLMPMLKNGLLWSKKTPIVLSNKLSFLWWCRMYWAVQIETIILEIHNRSNLLHQILTLKHS